MRIRAAILGCLLIVLAGAAPAPNPVVYVDKNATGANNGTSWTDAYVELRTALGAPQAPGTEIWVAAGTYLPTGTNLDTISFQLLPDVTLYGGFAGGETSLGQRNWKLNETILSGDIGIPSFPDDNTNNVVVAAAGAILDGFTVTGGHIDGSVLNHIGAGIQIQAPNVKVLNCVIRDNTNLIWRGGGAFNSSPSTYVNCVFSGNFAANTGGGLSHFNYGSPTLLQNCIFVGNSNGGIFCDASSIEAWNCTFTGNTYGVAGAGSLTNCILWGNSSFQASGPVTNYSCVQGGAGGGAGNTSADPLFVNAADPNGADDVFGTADDGVAVQLGSPAINTGVFPGGPGFDLVGTIRPRGAGVDMGAFEHLIGVAPTVVASGQSPIIVMETWIGSGSITDSDSTQWSLSVDHGDATAQNLPLSSVNLRPISHQFVSSGTFTVSVVATDDSTLSSPPSTIGVTVLSRAQVIAQLKTGIQTLVTGTELSPSLGSLLNQVLDSANLRLTQNRPSAAASLVRTFVNYLMRAPMPPLTNGSRQPLLDLANKLIANLIAFP